MNVQRAVSPYALAILMLAILGGCGDKPAVSSGPAGAKMPPPEVAVITIAPRQLALTNELPGRLEAARIAQVRARVPGVVLQRVFREGSEVKSGEVLYRIDPAPFQAAYNSAQATVARTEANLAQATLKAQRYAPLVESNAISKQEYDEVATAQKQAAADAAAARAAQESARLNLAYATVTAPIAGRIGRALVTEGALVGQGEATQLAVVQQLDPMFVNLSQSSAEILRLKQAFAGGKLKSVGSGQARITLTMEDGRPYPLPGKLLFSDIAVDEGTGAITLRAEFPNPERLLLPGMYVRARVEQAVSEDAITVPQQAVMRNANGSSVMVVGAGDKVMLRPVRADTSQGDSWIVSEGLQPGDRVIVEGFQKVKPDAVAKPVEWKNPLIAAPGK